MMTLRQCIVGFGLVLSACAPLSPAPESPAPQPQEQAPVDAFEGDTLPVVETGTGTVLPERMIPGGALELGLPDAPVTLFVVTHPSCGYCRALHQQLLPRIIEPYVAQGLVRLHTMVLPLKKYPESTLQAGLLLCAGKQGKGRAMLDWMMSQTVTNNKTTVLRNKTLPADAAALGTCLDDPTVSQTLAAQAGLLDTLGTRLVPTILLDGEAHTGLPSFADLEGMVKESISDNRLLQ